MKVKKVLNALAWPILELAKLLGSKGAAAAFRKFYFELLKTPLGKIAQPIIAELLVPGAALSEAAWQKAAEEIIAQGAKIGSTWKESVLDAAIGAIVQGLAHGWR